MAQTITRITTNTDTTVAAASGEGNRLRITSIVIGVEVEGTTALIRLENGASGAVIVSCLAAQGPQQFSWPATDPLILNENTVLNAETTGGAAGTWNVTVHHDG